MFLCSAHLFKIGSNRLFTGALKKKVFCVGFSHSAHHPCFCVLLPLCMTSFVASGWAWRKSIGLNSGFQPWGCGVEQLDGEQRAGESDKSEPKLLLQTLKSPALKKIYKKLSQFFCLWESCLPADLSLQGQAAFHYGLLSEVMCKSV